MIFSCFILKEVKTELIPFWFELLNLINKNINPALETMFLTADGKYTFLSSSVVREMAAYGADITGLVPNELIKEIENKAKQRRN